MPEHPDSLIWVAGVKPALVTEIIATPYLQHTVDKKIFVIEQLKQQLKQLKEHGGHQ